MEFLEVKQTMKLRGLPFDWQRLNVIRHHNRTESGETWKHYLCKAIMGKILYDANHNYFAEYEFPNKAVTDIFDVTTMTAIEFETGGTEKREQIKRSKFLGYLNTRVLNELFVINLDDVPNDLPGIDSHLRKRIGV
jgi:hypothetical protein